MMYVHTGKVRKRRTTTGFILMILALIVGLQASLFDGHTILAIILLTLGALIVQEANRRA